MALFLLEMRMKIKNIKFINNTEEASSHIHWEISYFFKQQQYVMTFSKNENL
jgi:hypothetical protein